MESARWTSSLQVSGDATAKQTSVRRKNGTARPMASCRGRASEERTPGDRPPAHRAYFCEEPSLSSAPALNPPGFSEPAQRCPSTRTKQPSPARRARLPGRFGDPDGPYLLVVDCLAALRRCRPWRAPVTRRRRPIRSEAGRRSEFGGLGSVRPVRTVARPAALLRVRSRPGRSAGGRATGASLVAAAPVSPGCRRAPPQDERAHHDRARFQAGWPRPWPLNLSSGPSPHEGGYPDCVAAHRPGSHIRDAIATSISNRPRDLTSRTPDAIGSMRGPADQAMMRGGGAWVDGLEHASRVTPHPAFAGYPQLPECRSSV